MLEIRKMWPGVQESRTGRDCRMRRMRYVMYAELRVPGIRWAVGRGHEGTDIGLVFAGGF